MFINSLESFFDNGLYKHDLITGPIPASSKTMYPKNWVIELIKPFTSDPYDSIINFGTIKPHSKVIIYKINDIKIFLKALFPRIVIPLTYKILYTILQTFLNLLLMTYLA